jgi:RNA polymerase sigma-70 factor (ECF subfamily)
LYGVARNVVARHWASVARQAATREALEHELTLSVEPLGTDDEPLWQAWHRLSEADREVLALVAWEELSVPSRALGAGRDGTAVPARGAHRPPRAADSAPLTPGRGLDSRDP